MTELPKTGNNAQEDVLYQDSLGNLVSTSRAILAHVTYPIGAITSVSSREVTSPGLALVLILAGIAIGWYGLTSRAPTSTVIGAICLVLGFVVAARSRSFEVIISTAAGEKVALKSSKRAMIGDIVQALNDAIIARG